MAQAENLQVTVSDAETENESVVVAAGQIDSHTSPVLDEALDARPGDGVTGLDLSEVSFIDSSGLRVIVRAHKRHLENGGRLVIESPSETVVRLLEMTGLTSQLEIGPSASS